MPFNSTFQRFGRPGRLCEIALRVSQAGLLGVAAVGSIGACTNTTDAYIDVCVEKVPYQYVTFLQVGKVSFPQWHTGYRCVRTERQANPDYREPGS